MIYQEAASYSGINNNLNKSLSKKGIMKVRAAIKKRSVDCKIVRRKGRLYVINKKNPRFKQRQG